MISEKNERDNPLAGRQDVRVSLRGADIAPVKASHIDSLVLLERKLMSAVHLVRTDPNVEEMLIDNMEGTLLAKMYGIEFNALADAFAAWNHWNEMRRGQTNREKPDFAKLTFLEIWHRSRKVGLLDLREKPQPRRIYAEEGAEFWDEPEVPPEG